eukprot:8965035-Alexandrium_andersonii.AAC.1
MQLRTLGDAIDTLLIIENVWGIFLMALLPRLWGMTYGLPYSRAEERGITVPKSDDDFVNLKLTKACMITLLQRTRANADLRR